MQTPSLVASTTTDKTTANPPPPPPPPKKEEEKHEMLLNILSTNGARLKRKMAYCIESFKIPIAAKENS